MPLLDNSLVAPSIALPITYRLHSFGFGTADFGFHHLSSVWAHHDLKVRIRQMRTRAQVDEANDERVRLPQDEEPLQKGRKILYCHAGRPSPPTACRTL